MLETKLTAFVLFQRKFAYRYGNPFCDAGNPNLICVNFALKNRNFYSFFELLTLNC